MPDDEEKLFWPESKKDSDAPGTLQANQLAVYCWHDVGWKPIY
jgi:hypothetical protein